MIAKLCSSATLSGVVLGHLVGVEDGVVGDGRQAWVAAGDEVLEVGACVGALLEPHRHGKRTTLAYWEVRDAQAGLVSRLQRHFPRSDQPLTYPKS